VIVLCACAKKVTKCKELAHNRKKQKRLGAVLMTGQGDRRAVSGMN